MTTSKGTERPSVATAATGRSAELELVDRCRRGELGAFEELYRAHSRRLFSLAVRMLGNPADAEDQLQEIFLSAHRKLESFRGESALPAIACTAMHPRLTRASCVSSEPPTT